MTQEEKNLMTEKCLNAFDRGMYTMLELVMAYLQEYHPTWYEQFGEELKKAMEE